MIVRQLIAAQPGYVLVHVNDAEGAVLEAELCCSDIEADPVVAWALIDEDGESHVVPVMAPLGFDADLYIGTDAYGGLALGVDRDGYNPEDYLALALNTMKFHYARARAIKPLELRS